MVDCRQQSWARGPKEIAQICHRRFGIGADGLILLQAHQSLDFRMAYFNSDGQAASMCGNGGRCLARFAHDLGIGEGSYRFEAVDGTHQAEVSDEQVRLSMRPTSFPQAYEEDWILDTGSPHLLRFLDSQHSLEDLPILEKARQLRYNEHFRKEGINVNFLTLVRDSQEAAALHMRTYERGVEDETWSCGTGVTAAAIVAHQVHQLPSPVSIHTPGGTLQVSFTKNNAEQQYQDIILQGPARRVFKGSWS